MPWVDTLFLDSREEAAPISGDGEGREEGGESGIFGADWTPVVRSVGAFVGIAYAIVCRLVPTISPALCPLFLCHKKG